MPEVKKPVAIKKYANRRLYNTGASSYVTLEDLAVMVKNGEDFIVTDAKTGEDITRSVLAQIIFEQEGKTGQSLLPISFLRQLIRFYGDSMQMLVPSYLEFSIDKLAAEQQKMREKMAAMLGRGPQQPGELFGAMEEQARKNMVLFNQALSVFNPFAAGLREDQPQQEDQSQQEERTKDAPASGGERDGSDLDDLRRQLEEMQRKLEKITRKT